MPQTINEAMINFYSAMARASLNNLDMLENITLKEIYQLKFRSAQQ